MKQSIETWAPLLDPRQTAVLVVDIQVQFSDVMGPRFHPPIAGVLANTQRFLDRAYEAGLTIVRIAAVINEDEVSESWIRQAGSQWKGSDPLDPSAETSKFSAGFEPRPGDLVVLKPRYGAFFKTSLEEMLRERGIKTVVVLGLTTDVCVNTTAREAFQLELNVVTLSDCTAEQTQARHESGLETLSQRFGLVCTSDEVVRAWEAHLARALA